MNYTNEQKVAFYKAVLEGRVLQYRPLPFSPNSVRSNWIDFRTAFVDINQNWVGYEYRLRPEPETIWKITYKYDGGTKDQYSFVTEDQLAEYCIGPYYHSRNKFIEVLEENQA